MSTNPSTAISFGPDRWSKENLARCRRARKAAGRILPPLKTVTTLSDYHVRGAKFNPVQLIIDNGLTEAEWTAIGRAITHVNSAAKWWIGDWLIAGGKAYGKRNSYAIAMQATGHDRNYLIACKWVANSFEPERRVEALSWSHHSAVASLPPEQADELLRLAAELGLTYSQLKDEREGKRKKSTRLTNKIGILLSGDVLDVVTELADGRSLAWFVGSLVRFWLEEHEYLLDASGRAKSVREQRKSAGLCPQCGKRKPAEDEKGKTLSACRRCLDLNNKWDSWNKHERQEIPDEHRAALAAGKA